MLTFLLTWFLLWSCWSLVGPDWFHL